jgi:hypothetical protein
MEHIAAILLLVGCSGDLKQCEELPAPTAIYETMEECDAQLSPALSAIRGTRDKTFGQCVYVDPAFEEEDAELVWDIDAAGRLNAYVGTPHIVVASIRSNPREDARTQQ